MVTITMATINPMAQQSAKYNAEEEQWLLATERYLSHILSF